MIVYESVVAPVISSMTTARRMAISPKGEKGSEGARVSAGVPRELTMRERQIVELIDGDGLTSKEVAYRLGIADATVRVLRARARKKGSLG